MNIAILAAGAGGMYCGSCMRDNDLATALKRLGHSVTLVPLYSPLRTDGASHSDSEVFYGGINVYLQHASKFFRHTPRAIDWLFDRPWLLGIASSMGAQTRPEKLADFTRDILQGEAGGAQKELHRLVEFLKHHVRPQVITLPNLMFIGLAQIFREELGAAVVCEMTGEDIFLDAMQENDRAQMRDLIRARKSDVSRFVATSDFYAGKMAEYLDIQRDQIEVVYTGVSSEYLKPLVSRDANPARPPTVGYLARICPEKGFDQVIASMGELIQRPGLGDAKLVIAGYLGARDRKWASKILQEVKSSALGESVTFLGEVDRVQKLAMLNSIDVFTVPTRYPESKGIYVLEALARGVPVVQPKHGAFPELIARTGGGLLAQPNSPTSIADRLAELLLDRGRAAELGRAGRTAVERDFTDEHMAQKMLDTFASVIK